MKKEDKILLAIGKCFSRSKLLPEDCDLLQSLSSLELVNKYQLNELQINLVKNWCKRSQQIRANSIDYSESYEEFSYVPKTLVDIYSNKEKS